MLILSNSFLNASIPIDSILLMFLLTSAVAKVLRTIVSIILSIGIIRTIGLLLIELLSLIVFLLYVIILEGFFLSKGMMLNENEN